MKLDSKLKRTGSKAMYEGIDISWDLHLSAMYIDEYQGIEREKQLELRTLEIAANTFYARLARNRAWLNKDYTRGKSYMACSPKLLPDNRSTELIDTEYSFYYWLNYGDTTTYGAFTVEQIQKWLEDDTLVLIDINSNGTDERPEKTQEIRKLYSERK